MGIHIFLTFTLFCMGSHIRIKYTQGSTLWFFVTCPVRQVRRVFTCPHHVLLVQILDKIWEHREQFKFLPQHFVGSKAKNSVYKQ